MRKKQPFQAAALHRRGLLLYILLRAAQPDRPAPREDFLRNGKPAVVMHGMLVDGISFAAERVAAAV